MSVLSFGSINLDLVSRSPRIPRPGETVLGTSFTTVPGGKGANQAVAVARLGLPSQLIGRVGGDRFGQELLASLRANGVGCDGIWVDESVHSGVAAIAIDEVGENQIIVIPGANGQMDRTDVVRLQPFLPTAQVLLLQLEIPLAAVIAAATAAQAAGLTVILDPAPAAPLPPELYAQVDILTPNQTEAAQLVGFEVNHPDDAARAAAVLRQRGVDTVLIKLGQQGAWIATATGAELIAPFPVEVVDTVGAGDAFNGALAAALVSGLSLDMAGRWGAAAGAIAVTRPGAQTAMPTQAELLTLLAQSPS